MDKLQEINKKLSIKPDDVPNHIDAETINEVIRILSLTDELLEYLRLKNYYDDTNIYNRVLEILGIDGKL